MNAEDYPQCPLVIEQIKKALTLKGREKVSYIVNMATISFILLTRCEKQIFDLDDRSPEKYEFIDKMVQECIDKMECNL